MCFLIIIAREMGQGRRICEFSAVNSSSAGNHHHHVTAIFHACTCQLLVSLQLLSKLHDFQHLFILGPQTSDASTTLFPVKVLLCFMLFKISFIFSPPQQIQYGIHCCENLMRDAFKDRKKELYSSSLSVKRKLIPSSKSNQEVRILLAFLQSL